MVVPVEASEAAAVVLLAAVAVAVPAVAAVVLAAKEAVPRSLL